MLNEIIHGDCLEVMKQLPVGCVDMILCDLPYGTTQNKWDSVIPLDNLWSLYSSVLKENGAIVLTASQPFTSLLVSSNPKWFRHEWIWIKNKGSNFANTVREPMKEHESILLFSKGKWTYNMQMQERTGAGGDRVKYNVKFDTTSANYGKMGVVNKKKLPESRVPSSWQKFNCEVGLHPTQKPVPLFEYLIKTYSNPGETILDNCIGSGTTAEAAISCGRNFIGIEKEIEYVEVARKRLQVIQPVMNF